MWVEMKQVQSIEDLKELGFDWLLKEYRLERCLNLWYDKGTTCSELPYVTSVEVITIAVIVLGCIFPKQVPAMHTDEGIYVNDEVFT